MNQFYLSIIMFSFVIYCPSLLDAQVKSQSKKATSSSSNPRSSSLSSKKNVTQKSKKKDKRLTRARADYHRGLAHFKAKKYKKALILFMKVYRVQSNPNLVYNMARSFEELEQYQNAASYYQEYLKINPNASDKASILLSIKTLKTLSQGQKSKKTVKQHNEHTPSSSHIAHQPWWKSKRSWGWISVGVGGVLSGLAMIYALDASDGNDKMQQAQNQASWQQALNQRSDSAMVADIFYVTASLSFASALYLLLSQDTSQASHKKTTTSVKAHHSIRSPLDVKVGVGALQFSYSF